MVFQNETCDKTLDFALGTGKRPPPGAGGGGEKWSKFFF